MALQLLMVTLVILLCIFSNRLSNKLGVPTLLLFIALGMMFGTDGLVKIPFENYDFAEQICSVMLIFIMFYGGFGTNWQMARPVAAQAFTLASLGVLLTAGLVGGFCYFILEIDLLESLLIGSVISSTDAASVFSILRGKKLNLKNGMASLLEVESGSNDPCSYMLTVIVLTLLKGDSSGGVFYLIFAQIAYGLAIGVLVALVSVRILRQFTFTTDGFDTIFVLAAALFAYALPTVLGGNGYLSVYICGIIIGNSRIKNKIPLAHFFDGVTGLAQMLIFFLLGLLATPSEMGPSVLPSILIILFLTFVARPLAVWLIMTPAKTPIRQQLLVSWAGLRGAASIVFAIMVVISGVETQMDIFHIVFCIALISVAAQGSLLPLVAKKLDVVDESGDVLKTFNDYRDDAEMQLMKVDVGASHRWINKKVQEMDIQPDNLIVMIKRGEETIIPRGDTVIQAGDQVILSVPGYYEDNDVRLREEKIEGHNPWIGKTVAELGLPKDELLILIKRDGASLVPKGETAIRRGDVVVLSQVGDAAAPAPPKPAGPRKPARRKGRGWRTRHWNASAAGKRRKGR